MWTCKKCATKVDPSFEVCWACGTSIDGVEDPNFVSADEDLSPIPLDEPEQPIHAGSSDELVECYTALDLMQAEFLKEQLTKAGIPAVCDSQDLHDMFGLMNATPKVRVLEKDLDRARHWLATYEQTIRNHEASTEG